MAGGLYGVSRGFNGNKPDNWAGHNTIPDFFRDDSLGDVDSRPVFMRSGFYPDHLAMDDALGEAHPIHYEPFTLGQANALPTKGKLADFVDNLKEHPYALIAVGVVVGVLVTGWMRGKNEQA